MAYYVAFLLVTAALTAILAFSGEGRQSAMAAKYWSLGCLVLSACLMWAAWRKRNGDRRR
jgi:NADH:ubiquinone oxidoreductase subunit 2 (subunit N)